MKKNYGFLHTFIIIAAIFSSAGVVLLSMEKIYYAIFSFSISFLFCPIFKLIIKRIIKINEETDNIAKITGKEEKIKKSNNFYDPNSLID